MTLIKLKHKRYLNPYYNHNLLKKMEHIEKKLKVLTVLVGLSLFFSLLTFASSLAISSKLSGGAAVADDNDDAAPTGGSPSANAPSADDDPVKGDEDAPVTIIEFSDFQCPFCARFYSETLPQLQSQYVDTGKVKLVFRDFPLTSIHPQAQKAHEASECADEQDKFWEYHDILFENQGSLDVASLKSYAADLRLDTNKFNTCLDSGKYAGEIRKDTADGAQAGVTGTPSFFVNGQQLVGAQPFSAFQQAIEAAL